MRVRVHRAGKHRHEYIKIKHVSKPVMNKCTDLVPLVLWSSAAPEWSVQFGCVGSVHTFTVCLCACVLLFSFFSHFLRFNYFDGVVIFIYVFIF